VQDPDNLLYSKEHEWVKVDGDTATIGITDYAQNSLGDIVYVELPRVGKQIEQFGNVGVVESVKAVSDLFTPVSGEVLETNGSLEADPAAVNRDPYGAGWLFKVKLKNADGEKKNLLSAADYGKLAHD
jgi:glycine cleavage system H protein